MTPSVATPRDTNPSDAIEAKAPERLQRRRRSEVTATWCDMGTLDSGTDTVTGRWNLRRRGSSITTGLTARTRSPAILATTSGFTFTDCSITRTAVRSHDYAVNVKKSCGLTFLFIKTVVYERHSSAEKAKTNKT